MVVVIKCRKCRHELVGETDCQRALVSAHGDTLNLSQPESCSSGDQDSLWFLHESATSWIAESISKHEWTKGKLNCPHCKARVGSFDFVSTSKCACGSVTLPAVHLVKSKVDSLSLNDNMLGSLRS
ncbi:E3 ubiquitin-protein ligase RNF180 [Frankliniella fusca]|uniref:E3 ubiquitin-protein ligase RNF180 n=1 Tax=Frankliniella fusca TaxID=407009 RepID=A0AAE1HMA6_9NEOP|nr:E3 ubiquitin-protein ligase RNF180 [Frankliniella fusca]